MNEWLGPNKNAPRSDVEFEPKEGLVSFTSDLPLQEALERIRNYAQAFNRKNSLAFTYRLISVSEVPTVETEILSFFEVLAVEGLPQSVEDLE